ncbi:HAD-IA family hydrolase [Planobispora rosea]|uniref:HAD-IA family hydrolase n=1 Tax=Planobispora rosea TaxID=35762 RepID=UPI00083A8F66|nr:HAD-IA family hydrolase [Planobispora rosea]
MPFDAVLCDFYDVIGYIDLTDHDQRERACGLAAGTTEKIAFAPGLARSAALGQITVEQWTDAITDGLSALAGSAEVAGELARGFVGAGCRIDEEVADLLRQVRRRVPVVLVSNSTAQIETVLEATGLDRAFDAVVTSARVGVAKPDRRIYEAAAREAGAAVDRCLFVDDRAANVAAAVELGMTGVVYGGPADLAAALSPLLE